MHSTHYLQDVFHPDQVVLLLQYTWTPTNRLPAFCFYYTGLLSSVNATLWPVWSPGSCCKGELLGELRRINRISIIEIV